MNRQTRLLLVLIPCVFAAGWLLRARITAPEAPHPASSGDATATSKTAQDTARLEETLLWLQNELTRTEKERARLAERVAALETRLAAPVTQPATGADPPDVDVAVETSPANRTYRTTLDTLVAAGIPEPLAADIQTRLDAFDLKQAYLRDRASREGWLGTPRYQEQARELQEAYRDLRPDIGDDAYDRLLYALGRTNRVAVRDVIQFSPAAQADLRPGDEIYAYADRRVFTVQELITLTGEGSVGVPVLVQVKRAGELLNVYLPRGPLGIRPVAAQEAPE